MGGVAGCGGGGGDVEEAAGAKSAKEGGGERDVGEEGVKGSYFFTLHILPQPQPARDSDHEKKSHLRQVSSVAPKELAQGSNLRCATWDGLASSACWSSRCSRSWSREATSVARRGKGTAVNQDANRTRDARVITHTTGIPTGIPAMRIICVTAVPEGPPMAATALCVNLTKAIRYLSPRPARTRSPICLTRTRGTATMLDLAAKCTSLRSVTAARASKLTTSSLAGQKPSTAGAPLSKGATISFGVTHIYALCPRLVSSSYSYASVPASVSRSRRRCGRVGRRLPTCRKWK